MGRLVKYIAMGIAGFIGVLIFLAVCDTVFSRVHNVVKDHNDKDRIAAAEKTAVLKNKGDVDGRIQSYNQAGPQTTELTRTVTNSCYIDHSDSGWMANSYGQHCYVKTMVGLEVNGRSAALASEDCGIQSEWQEQNWAIDQTGPQKPECQIPDVDSPDLSVVAYAQAGLKTQVISHTGATPESTQSVIWLTHVTKYWDEGLGCSQPEVLFCNSPRATPVMPSNA